jgi:hypothetical protein
MVVPASLATHARVYPTWSDSRQEVIDLGSRRHAIPPWFLVHYYSQAVDGGGTGLVHVVRFPSGRLGDRAFASLDRALEAVALLMAADGSIDSLIGLAKFVDAHARPLCSKQS